MKKKNFNAKLSLNKKVISDLHTRKLKGGTNPVEEIADGNGNDDTQDCGTQGGAPTCAACVPTNIGCVRGGLC